MRPQCGRPPSDSVRPSPQAEWTARTLRWGVRPFIELLPDSATGVRIARHLVAGFLAAVGRRDPGVSFTRVEESGASGDGPDERAAGPGADVRVRGEWVTASGTPGAPGRPDLGRGVILYLHGSAFAVCSSRTHRGITGGLAAATGLPVFACDYRLAPSHRFPAAAEDVAAAHAWLVAEGVDPSRIVVAGDSAGGHLAVDLAASLRDAHRPVPAGLVLFSPLIDLSLARARRRDRGGTGDPMISPHRAARLLAHYLRDAEPDSPRLRFAAATVRGLGPVLVHAGGAEMLADDAVHLADLIRAAGGEVSLRVWPGQVHVFQALSAVVPEASTALAEAAAFVERCLPPAPALAGEAVMGSPRNDLPRGRSSPIGVLPSHAGPSVGAS